MDAYEDVRNLPLLAVLSMLGFSDYKQTTDGWAGKCPVHQPKKNQTAFRFTQDGKFNCFGCKLHGRGAIDLVMAVRKVGFQDAVEYLNTLDVGYAVIKDAKKPEIRQLQVVPTENPPYKGVYEKFFKPHPWLKDRGLTNETLKLYETGYYDNPARRSPYSGSVMLKIRRWCDGECVAYVSRNIGDITPENPKYRFPANFHKSLELFGAHQIKNPPVGGPKLPLRTCFIVESPFTVMAFHQKKFPAVSPFGWSLSEQQIELLPQIAKGWIYLPDRDKHTEIGESVRKLAQRCWVKTPPLPGTINDPEYLSLEQINALA